MAQTLRAAFDHCLASRTSLTLILKSAVQFTGIPVSAHDDAWTLDLPASNQRCILAPSEVAAILTARPLPLPPYPVSFAWQAETPTPTERQAAEQTLASLTEALASLGPLPNLTALHLISSHAGRLRIVEGVLQVGFTEEVPPPPAQEFRSLLAMIL